MCNHKFLSRDDGGYWNQQIQISCLTCAWEITVSETETDVENILTVELRARAEQERIDIQIKRRKWSWIRHTLRKHSSNVTRHALRWNPQGKRSQGHPRNSWRRTVDNKVGKAGYTWRQIEKLAQNRTRWRAFSLLHGE